MFENLEPTSTLRYHIYYHLVQVANQCGHVSQVFTDIEQLNLEFKQCPPSIEQMRKLYTFLHDLLKDNTEHKHLDLAVLNALIKSYLLESWNKSMDGIPIDELPEDIVNMLNMKGQYSKAPALLQNPPRYRKIFGLERGGICGIAVVVVIFGFFLLGVVGIFYPDYFGLYLIFLGLLVASVMIFLICYFLA